MTKCFHGLKELKLCTFKNFETFKAEESLQFWRLGNKIQVYSSIFKRALIATYKEIRSKIKQEKINHNIQFADPIQNIESLKII